VSFISIWLEFQATETHRPVLAGPIARLLGDKRPLASEPAAHFLGAKCPFARGYGLQPTELIDENKPEIELKENLNLGCG
jgi:hypothetical protein